MTKHLTLTTVVILALGPGCSVLLNPELPGGIDGTLLKFGQTCTVDGDCESNMCDRRCTQACNANTTCPSGTSCEGQVCEFDGPPPLTGTIKAGYLYVGPVGDHGWTLTHEEGRMYTEANLSDFESTFAPSVSTAAAPQAIDDFIASGSNVIIATSFDFLVPMLSAAQNNPDVNFLLCSGFMTGPNLGSYFAHMEQAIYMTGYLAGLKTKTNKIGAVGPVVIPETVRHINAFARGARDANPNAKVLVRWVYAWFAPPEETQATIDLVNAGADIIFGQTDTTIPVEVSSTLTTTNTGSPATDNLPVYSIGYDNKDSCERFAPDRCLASAYWQWGPMVTKILQEMRDGTWKPRVPIFDQMKSDPAQSTVYVSPLNESIVESDIRIEVEGLISLLTANTAEAKYYPFRPPLRDNKGVTRVATGSLPSDTDLINMCWFTEGTFELDGITPAAVPMQCIGVR
jgi:basic membrane protein A